MTRRRTLLLALVATLVATGAYAGDFEYSPRHLALADTGNAIFNPAILPPVLENIAGACDSNQFYIGGSTRQLVLAGVGSDSDADYNFLEIDSGSYIQGVFPVGEDKDDDWTDRAGLVFQPGLQAQYLRVKTNREDSNLELADSLLAVSPTIRFGAAYGFHEIFAMGIGFTMIPSTIFNSALTGTQDTPDGTTNKDIEDKFTMAGSFMILPEVGFLFRTPERMQFGLTYEMGYAAKAKREIEHSQVPGDIDYETEVAYIKPHNIGLGWAYEIPQEDNFYVSVDFDVYFRQKFEGDTWVMRGRESYTQNDEDEDGNAIEEETVDPNEDQLGEEFYASTNGRYVFSSAVEKAWETVGIRGGLGYSAETGLDRDRPASTFFMTVGPTLYFDETIFMSAGGRLDLGFARAETTYAAVGGGASLSLGGTF